MAYICLCSLFLDLLLCLSLSIHNRVILLAIQGFQSSVLAPRTMIVTSLMTFEQSLPIISISFFYRFMVAFEIRYIIRALSSDMEVKGVRRSVYVCLKGWVSYLALRTMSLKRVLIMAITFITLSAELNEQFSFYFKSFKAKSTYDIFFPSNSSSNNSIEVTYDKSKVFVPNYVNYTLQGKLEIFRLIIWLATIWSVD